MIRGLRFPALSFLSHMAHYGRFASGMRQYLSSPVASDSRGEIRRRLEHREETWLRLVRRTVFAQPDHPYRRMFGVAGCEMGDLEAAVRRRGLEDTLTRLRGEGVYLSADEFKGRTPIERSGVHIPSTATSFTTPSSRGWLGGASSGSSGGARITTSGTRHLLLAECYLRLTIEEFQLDRFSMIVVRPILPSTAGLVTSIPMNRFGLTVDSWFAPGSAGSDSLHYRGLTSLMVAMALLHGLKTPFPRSLGKDEWSLVAKLISSRKEKGVSCVVSSFVRPAVQLAAAAVECGYDISGTVFLVGGEAMTNSKRNVIESAGGRVSLRYWISEIGPIGFACSEMRGNCVHLFDDTVVAVNDSTNRPAVFFTTLDEDAPSFVINAEMGDCGFVEDANCQCEFRSAGISRQIRDIASRSRITTLGMTLEYSDVAAIVEESLPRRFGGAPTDYQLIETERGTGTGIDIRIHPRVTLADASAIADYFLQALRSYYGGAAASRVWAHAGAVRVVRAEPRVTVTGKVLPIYLLDQTSSGNRDS